MERVGDDADGAIRLRFDRNKVVLEVDLYGKLRQGRKRAPVRKLGDALAEIGAQLLPGQSHVNSRCRILQFGHAVNDLTIVEILCSGDSGKHECGCGRSTATVKSR